MTGDPRGSRTFTEAAIDAVLTAYPMLTTKAAITFLQVCADDGLSVKALSKRLDLGQSLVLRHLSDLQGTSTQGPGLVEVQSAREDGLRQTVHLSAVGLALKERSFEVKVRQSKTAAG